MDSFQGLEEEGIEPNANVCLFGGVEEMKKSGNTTLSTLKTIELYMVKE